MCLNKLAIRATVSNLDDLIFRATRGRFSPRDLLVKLVRAETADRAYRNQQRLLGQARR